MCGIHRTSEAANPEISSLPKMLKIICSSPSDFVPPKNPQLYSPFLDEHCHPMQVSHAYFLKSYPSLFICQNDLHRRGGHHGNPHIFHHDLRLCAPLPCVDHEPACHIQRLRALLSKGSKMETDGGKMP